MTTRLWQIQDLESFDSKMAVSISFQFPTKLKKKFVVLASERDISCYIFQNISRTKLILIHKKVPDIITNSTKNSLIV